MADRILLVEDDPIIIESLAELLASEGYAVDVTATEKGAVAKAASQAEPPSLVLLDVTLAQGNGFAACHAIKKVRPELPVIFLTASDDEVSTVFGIQLGAEDYVAKPFRPRELLARIAAAIKRAQPGRRALVLGPLTIDTDRGVVERDGEEVLLSALEYRLLLFFAMNEGKVVTREAIRDVLWDTAGTYIEENTLSVYIKRLRNKIEDDPCKPRIILTVRGAGYKAVSPGAGAGGKGSAR